VRFLSRVDAGGFALVRGERALIHTEIVGGTALATTQALHLLLVSPERIEWWQIKHVSFDPDTLSLRLTTETLVAQVQLSTPSLIAEVIRERVTATILMSTTYVTANQAKAVISLRRRSARGFDETFIEIDWQGTPSPGGAAEAELRGRALQEQAQR
jgi:hypothetical protein